MTARLPGLDALRGVAIALVLLRHALPEVFPGAGVVGVVMFFALSGYLITGVLLRELNSTGGLSFGAFYLRRARRLVPALVAMLVVLSVVTLTLDPLHDRAELPRTLVVALTWTANLPFDQGSDAIFHLWTLAGEEQFYLVWPALLFLAVRRGRVRALLIAAAVLGLAATALTQLWAAPHPDLGYALPTSWAVCFVVGAACRVAQDRWPAPGRNLAWLALLTLIALSMVALRGHLLTYLLGGPVIAGLTSVLILAARGLDLERLGPASLRLLRPLVALGTISYGAYLWSYPLTLWLREAIDHQELAGSLAAVATVLAAAASWRWVERPFLSRATQPAPVQVGA